MSDGLIHKLGWKIGTSRGTACGLEWDSPAMKALSGQPVSPQERSFPPWVAVEGAERVTCQKCREKIGQLVDVDIARAPGKLQP